ncbi:MAG TPA: hypothetical protein VFJ28_06205 [Marmoricola sp.]|nr:hypothetical protein [Marmoricola sp.]
MAPLETAIKELRQVLAADTSTPEWRWLVRGRLSEVKEALADPQVRQWDGWLSARARTTSRERGKLHARVSALAAVILEKLEPDAIQREVSRLVSDLEHYVQKVHDLVYDSVSLELGGSE